MPATATPVPGKTLLSPADHMLILIDYQSQMAFATKSIPAEVLRNNAGLIAAAAAGFKVPTILTTVAEKSFSGPMFEEVCEPFGKPPMLDRTSMNTWEDAAVIVEVYVITDACGDVSEEAHERAVARMIQAGARPMTALQYLLELQRDWARVETYEMTTGIARKLGGAYGLGIHYAKAMFGAQEGGH